jgi:hypothetical protein
MPDAVEINLVSFLKNLREAGRVVVGPEPLTPEVLTQCQDELRQTDELARLELPGSPPPISMNAALWAAGVMYWACQCMVYREIPPEAVKHCLAFPCPVKPRPSAAYSVDLTFRHLPRVIALAGGLSPDDPLGEGLKNLARAWPLSSVGVAGLGEVSVESFIGNPCLAQLYADRILAAKDTARAGDPRIRPWLVRSLGMYGELCPQISRLLECA